MSLGTSRGGRVIHSRGATGGRGQFNLSGMADQQQIFLMPTTQQPDFSISRGRGTRYLQNPFESLSHPCKVDVAASEVDLSPAVRETKKEAPSIGATQPTTVASSVGIAEGNGTCISCHQSEETNRQLLVALLKDLGTSLVNFASKLENPTASK